jgi:integrase
VALDRLIRYVHCPYLFVNPRTNKRRVNPEKGFERGAKKAKLKWVRFHDLRRFRATHWLRMGVDVRTVKELLGHQDVKTTMRYAFLVPDFAIRSVRDAQANEARELAEELERVKNG